MSDEELRLIHLVDDDEAIRRSVGFMLKTSGYHVRTYDSGVEFLKGAPNLEAGCILLDVRMPGMDGLEVQAALRDKGVTLPVVIMTGHGDVSLAVQAMKAGAVDFIEKPFEKAVLLSAIEHGVERLRKSAANLDRADEAAVRLQALTPREREVLELMAEGRSNQAIGARLFISPRAVEKHVTSIFTKLRLPAAREDHRRVLAVLRFLGS